MYRFIESQDRFEESLNLITYFKDVIGLDTETTGLDCFTDEVLLVQIALDDQIFIYNVRKLGISALKQLVSKLYNKTCIIHSAKFDMKFLYNKVGIWLRDVYCTLTTEAILHAGILNVPLGLKALVKKYCNYEMDKEERSEFINFPADAQFTEQMLVYSALDVKFLKDIYLKQTKLISEARENKILSLEDSLLPVVSDMEYTGIKLDTNEWMSLEAKNREILSAKAKEFIEYCVEIIISNYRDKDKNGLQVLEECSIPVKRGGKKARQALEEIKDIENLRGWLLENFNPESNKQMLSILKLEGVPTDNSNEKVIQRFAKDYEVVRQLLDFRGVAKQVSTYGKSWLNNIHPITGRVHTEFFSLGTRTGRFSSSRPNMQNVPTDGGFRECFIPEEDYVFISCDYSQQEYRLAGAVSKEPVIISAYKNGYDMHTSTAANFKHKELKEVTKEERKWGKTRNFEIIYGTTEWGLSKSLKCSLDEAKETLEKYWDGYPILHKFKTLIEDRILKEGYSCTPLGRRRYNEEKPTFMDSRQLFFWRERVKREGFNLIIQGGGADIMKIAMVNLWNKNPFGDKFRILLQIHDELVFEVHKSIVKEAGEFIRKEMEDAEQPFLGEIPAVVEGYDEVKLRWTK